MHHECGYAGRVDMIAKLKEFGWAVVDFKTQKVKRGSKGELKPRFYETWPLQLSAYQQAILCNGTKNVSALVSVVIDSGQPGPLHVARWTGTEYFKTFLGAYALWKFVKDYDPLDPAFNCPRPELN